MLLWDLGPCGLSGAPTHVERLHEDDRDDQCHEPGDSLGGAECWNSKNTLHWALLEESLRRESGGLKVFGVCEFSSVRSLDQTQCPSERAKGEKALCEACATSGDIWLHEHDTYLLHQKRNMTYDSPCVGFCRRDQPSNEAVAPEAQSRTGCPAQCGPQSSGSSRS